MNRQRLNTLAAVALIFAPTVGIAQSTIPSRLTDKEIWQLNADFSEAGGYFRSDNLLSNETGFQAVIPYLRGVVKPGGVYLGVGPEQNFTYIVSLQPKMAIIFDIRRGNMIEHLMYKALFEMSADRADFLSKLFSRPRPSGLDRASSPQRLFEAYVAVAPDTMAYKKNLAAISRTWLVTRLRDVATTTSSRWSMSSPFYEAGPQINYTSRVGRRRRIRTRQLPTYATLQSRPNAAGRTVVPRDGGELPVAASDFETKNLVVPVVGDFAGPKAIRAVAQYLKQRGAIVGAFYTSNVEQYLFQQDDEWIALL